jgi:hypothetical protein
MQAKPLCSDKVMEDSCTFFINIHMKRESAPNGTNDNKIIIKL